MKSVSSASVYASGQPTSRPFNFLLWTGIPVCAMLLLLWMDPTALDFAIEFRFYLPGEGFIGRHSFWLEDILHDKAKQVVILIALAAVVGFVLSFWVPVLFAWRRALGYVVLALVLSTGIVRPLKVLTQVHCPWSLKEFGGIETYTALLQERAPAMEPGRCWPGGHASSGFALLSLFFALRDRYPRAARAALCGALALGALFSLGRMMQGAHFLSHNVWTLLLDWVICLVLYRLVLYRLPQLSAVREQAVMVECAEPGPG